MRSKPKKLDVLHLAFGTNTGMILSGTVCSGIILVSPPQIAVVAVLTLMSGLFLSERRRVS